jgi:cytochrome b involved in lipid metabolism
MDHRRVPDRQLNEKQLSELKVVSRSTVHQLIAKGQLIVIANTRVLRLDKWLKRHPGGEKTILHMVGRDATDEINRYSITRSGSDLPVDIIQKRHCE